MKDPAEESGGAFGLPNTDDMCTSFDLGWTSQTPTRTVTVTGWDETLDEVSVLEDLMLQ